jgi:outer membrane protein
MTSRSCAVMLRQYTAVLLALACAAAPGWAQQVSIEPVRPKASVIVRPYLAPDVPPVRLANSTRLSDLVRAGNLYLTVQDAIALALENNIDLEVARYNPILAVWNLERSEAGGALPGVPSGASQTAAVASGQGVAGSQAAAGVAGGGGAAAAGAGNATIAQIGPVTQNLDPTIQQTAGFGHTSAPQVNATQSQTNELISNTRVYNTSLQQGFLTGGSATLSYTDHYLNENAPTDLLNPSSANGMTLQIQHSLLQGFGIGVNSRTIRVSRINLNSSDLNFKTQVINLVVNVLNQYYSLVADQEDVTAKQAALDVAQQFLKNTQAQERIGTLARLDVTGAEAQVATSQMNLVISQSTLSQQELQLKNLLSRNGIADPLLAPVHIVPLDRIVVPTTENLPSTAELVQTALANRSDLAVARANINAAEISALGTENGVLPNLRTFITLTNAGLSGVPRTVISHGKPETPDPYFVGGIGNALGQVFRHNFPTERIGLFLQLPIRNRQAQADYGTDQLSLRQTELTTEKQLSQVVVDVSNYVIALRQARARYQAAAQNHILQQQLLDAEQKKFAAGLSTSFNVIQQQQNVAAAASTEVAALVAYSNARTALDRTLGTTLDANHVSIDEARAGRETRTSSIPPNVK